eukprot:scaffold51055_cov376-Isochrysis_galbana.AAC.2
MQLRAGLRLARRLRHRLDRLLRHVCQRRRRDHLAQASRRRHARHAGALVGLVVVAAHVLVARAVIAPAGTRAMAGRAAGTALIGHGRLGDRCGVGGEERGAEEEQGKWGHAEPGAEAHVSQARRSRGQRVAVAMQQRHARNKGDADGGSR